jgi:hypothetical protein
LTLASSDNTFGQTGGRLRNLPRLTAPSVAPDTLSRPQGYQTNTITTVDPDFETPTTQMWSFGLQREIPGRFVVSADYIGRRAYNLFGAYNSNTIDVRRNGFLEAFNSAKAGGESTLLDTLTAPHGLRRAGESGAAFLRRQFSAEMSLNSAAAVAQALGRRIEGGVNLPAAAGLSPTSLHPSRSSWEPRGIIDSNDFSTYHGWNFRFSGTSVRPQSCSSATRGRSRWTRARTILSVPFTERAPTRTRRGIPSTSQIGA